MVTALKLIGLKVPSLLLYLGRNFPSVAVKSVVFSKTSSSHPRTLQSKFQPRPTNFRRDINTRDQHIQYCLSVN
jgi:hypothetical protein